MKLFNGQYNTALEQYLSSAPRYRMAVIGVKSSTEDESVLNIGRELASAITKLGRWDEMTFQFEVQEALNQVIQEHTFKDPVLGDVVIIENPGILFEPELHIDVPELLRRVSRNTLVILLWPGEVSKDKLSFLRSTSAYSIHQSDTNYIVL